MDEVADALERLILFAALRDLLGHYVRLVNSGDAGFWDPETEDVVIAARRALKVSEDRN